MLLARLHKKGTVLDFFFQEMKYDQYAILFYETEYSQHYSTVFFLMKVTDETSLCRITFQTGNVSKVCLVSFYFSPLSEVRDGPVKPELSDVFTTRVEISDNVALPYTIFRKATYCQVFYNNKCL